MAVERGNIEKKCLDEVPKWGFAVKFCVAFISASVAETVTYPLDLTKTRMQIQGELQKSASVPIQKLGMFRTATGIVKQEGFFHLWSGLSPALCRHVIYSGIRMAFYEHLRDNVLGKNPDGSFPIYKAAVAGLLAGGFAQFTASPLDLVKVQLQMEGRRKLEGKPVRVTNIFQAFRSIYREGGVRGLYKGVIPNVQRGALVNLGDLTTYDTAKRFFLRNTKMKDSYLLHIFSSLLAGFTATVLATPADVIKTRVMNQPTKDGVGIYYKGSLDCLQKTIQNEGFVALYKGFIPIWMRLGPWSLTFWVVFEKIRNTANISSF